MKIIITAFILFLSTALPCLGGDACISCHGDSAQMSSLGHPRMVVGKLKHSGKSDMYKSWSNSEPGPHDCGPSFDDGYPGISKNTRLPFTRAIASLHASECRSCHAGCTDCHDSSGEKNSPNTPHPVMKKIDALICYGAGRPDSCHAETQEDRRGAGYVGGSFSIPAGLAPDVHMSKGISCLDCHESKAKNGRLAHGEVKRRASCKSCHRSVMESVAKSIHRNVSCEACHIAEASGRQASFWGPGKIKDASTPFYRYSQYYGIMRNPLILKNQKGVWIPVKPYPAGVLNQKTAGSLRKGLSWRYSPDLQDEERTDDAYAFVGLLSGLEENDSLLAWIQMDKLSHGFGRSRSCSSCHSKNGEQTAEAEWKYSGEGAEPFSGGHTVTAGKKGLYISWLSFSNPIQKHIKKGWMTEYVAPWAFFRDRWKVKGDFAVPEVKRTLLYEDEEERYLAAQKKGSAFH